jgi:hypothetical protein
VLVYSHAVPENLVKSLALARLGRLGEAKAALDQAKRNHANFPEPLEGWTDGYHDWYMCELLIREAQALIDAPLRPDPQSPLDAG